MLIKDIEVRAELSSDESAKVRGGDNFAVVGGQFANQAVFGGGIFSPTTAVSAPVNAPVVIQNDNDPVTIVDIDTANVLASMGTFISQ